MTNLVIRRILETVILSMFVLIACSVSVGMWYYVAFGGTVAIVQSYLNFAPFSSENRWWLYGIVLVYDVLFWPGAIIISVNKAFIKAKGSA